MKEHAWTYEDAGNGVGILWLSVPDRAVNVLTPDVVDELRESADELRREDLCNALVLASRNPRSWVAGADVKAMAGVRDRADVLGEVQRGQQTFASIERLGIPVVAALSGVALGGGLELALACTARIAADHDKVELGLPETQLGIVPAWGGTVRLTRLVGLSSTLPVILGGKRLRPAQARRIGLVDEVVAREALIEVACKRAAQLAAGTWKPDRRHGLRRFLLDRTWPGQALVKRMARKGVLEKTGGHYPAPLRALEVIDTGMQEGAEVGFEAEGEAAAELLAGDIAHRLIDLFLAREGTKVELEGEELPERCRLGVVGAGVMGAGIAQVAAYRGCEVALRDIGMEQLTPGMKVAWQGFAGQVERRRLKPAEAHQRMELILPGLGLEHLHGRQLVVEAVVENLDVKRKVFAQLEASVDEACVLASNTSSLRIDHIARDLFDPSRMIGLHFFNPVPRMPLVEVVRGAESSDRAVAIGVAVARQLGKTPIVVADGPGFLVNRLLMPYLAEAMSLVDEGLSVERIDRVATEFGMPMGPLRLIDEIGLDIAEAVAGILADSFGDRVPRPKVLSQLILEGHKGKKGGSGFYTHGKRGGRKAKARPRKLEGGGIVPQMDDAEVLDRIVLPMINEAYRALHEDEIVASAAELDVAMVFGTGFPPFHGGPIAYARSRDLSEVAARLSSFGGRFRPSQALLDAVSHKRG